MNQMRYSLCVIALISMTSMFGSPGKKPASQLTPEEEKVVAGFLSDITTQTIFDGGQEDTHCSFLQPDDESCKESCKKITFDSGSSFRLLSQSDEPQVIEGHAEGSVMRSAGSGIHNKHRQQLSQSQHGERVRAVAQLMAAHASKLSRFTVTPEFQPGVLALPARGTIFWHDDLKEMREETIDQFIHSLPPAYYHSNNRDEVAGINSMGITHAQTASKGYSITATSDDFTRAQEIIAALDVSQSQIHEDVD